MIAKCPSNIHLIPNHANRLPNNKRFNYQPQQYSKQQLTLDNHHNRTISLHSINQQIITSQHPIKSQQQPLPISCKLQINRILNKQPQTQKIFNKQHRNQPHTLRNKFNHQPSLITQERKCGKIRKNCKNILSNYQIQQQQNKAKFCFCTDKELQKRQKKSFSCRLKILNNLQSSQNPVQCPIRQSFYCKNSSKAQISRQKSFSSISLLTKHQKLLPPQKDIIYQQDSQKSGNSTNQLSPYFQKLFNYLDNHKRGIINLQNCYTQNLSANLKYIFGSLLSKVKYKNINYNLDKFVSECQLLILTLQPNEVQNIKSQIQLIKNTDQISASMKTYSESIVMDTLNQEIVSKQNRDLYKGFFNSTQLEKISQIFKKQQPLQKNNQYIGQSIINKQFSSQKKKYVSILGNSNFDNYQWSATPSISNKDQNLGFINEQLCLNEIKMVKSQFESQLSFSQIEIDTIRQ